jgi:hypothetical protein
MANRPLAGSGPVPFTTGDKLYFVPTTDLTITADGAVDSTKWRGTKFVDGSAEQKALDAFVSALVARETLKPAPMSAPGPALVFRAAREGEAGNGITVTVSKLAPDAATPGNSKLDLVVVESAEFKGLSTQQANAKFVGKVLDAAASPPLVKLKAALAADIEYPLAGTYEAAGPADIVVPQKADATKSSFVLVDADGAAGPVASVVVTATDEPAKVFALKVTRTTKLAGAKLVDVTTAGSAAANAVKHVIVVEAPTGKPPALPKAGDYKLSGGSSEVTVPAAKSSIVTFAG